MTADVTFRLGLMGFVLVIEEDRAVGILMKKKFHMEDLENALSSAKYIEHLIYTIF